MRAGASIQPELSKDVPWLGWPPLEGAFEDPPPELDGGRWTGGGVGAGVTLGVTLGVTVGVTTGATETALPDAPLEDAGARRFAGLGGGGVITPSAMGGTRASDAGTGDCTGGRLGGILSTTALSVPRV
jgi:hypothetical protein